MSIWKKAASSFVAAAMLTSLLATSALAVKGPLPTDSDQTDVLNCTAAAIHTTATCSQVADGISTVTLTGDAGVGAAYSLYITATGATIIGAAGDFVLAGGVVTAPAGATLDATDTITLRSPSAAGTATVSVYKISVTTGIATLEGTLTITFTASSGLAVSAANSVVSTRDSCAVTGGAFSGTSIKTAPASPTNTDVAKLCVMVKDASGNLIADGTKVTATITPVGLLVGATTGQTTTATTTSGVAQFTIRSTGVAGAATIGVTVTVGSTDTTLTPATFTFTGAVASITATAHILALLKTGPAVADVVRFTAKDAAGNAVVTTGSTVVVTGSVFTAVVGSETNPSCATTGAQAGKVTVTCNGTEGSGTITVKNGTILSNAVTIYCSGAADTFTVAFDKKTVAPGGQSTLTATVKDSAGQPAPDGTPFTVVVSSGAVLADNPEAAPNGALNDTSNGVATWTFVAPFNTGTVTALVSTSADTTTTSPQSASITVGTVQPLTVFSPTMSALGNTTTGPFTFATKIQAIGKYITWKVDGGSGLAGKTIQIWVYKKYSPTGAWAGPTMLTTRVANASGVAYVNIITRGVLWLSLRPVLPATATDAAVWGPTSIGRWR